MGGRGVQREKKKEGRKRHQDEGGKGKERKAGKAGEIRTEREKRRRRTAFAPVWIRFLPMA